VVDNSSTPGHCGICAGDVALLDRALRGLVYPVEKRQLIDHAQRHPAELAPSDQRALDLLWALPVGHYRSLAQVLVCAARTVRGHPRRESTTVPRLFEVPVRAGR
jgi:Protein of unknown function (DUF2795)